MSDFERYAVQRLIDKAAEVGITAPADVVAICHGTGYSYPARAWAAQHPDDDRVPYLLTPTRMRLLGQPTPWVIENVPGPDPAVEPCHETGHDTRWRGGQPVNLTPDSHDGATLCGMEMLCSEQWVSYTGDDAERLTRTTCRDGAAGFVQEAML